MFQFQKFKINDDRCAMKVGTDGVLLGAWTEIHSASGGSDGDHLAGTAGIGRAVDIGTGSGLVALMLAQRFPTLHITAVEIDAEAAMQARENVEESPFSRQITVVTDDACHFATQMEAGSFDLVVSNPPFFQETLLPPDASRATARHTTAGLDFPRLADIASTLLRPDGHFAVIIPKTSEQHFHAICNTRGLSLIHATDIRTVQRKPVRRILMLFQNGPAPEIVRRDEIILMNDGQRSEAYSELCKDFYL